MASHPRAQSQVPAVPIVVSHICKWAGASVKSKPDHNQRQLTRKPPAFDLAIPVSSISEPQSFLPIGLDPKLYNE